MSGLCKCDSGKCSCITILLGVIIGAVFALLFGFGIFTMLSGVLTVVIITALLILLLITAIIVLLALFKPEHKRGCICQNGSCIIGALVATIIFAIAFLAINCLIAKLGVFIFAAVLLFFAISSFVIALIEFAKLLKCIIGDICKFSC